VRDLATNATVGHEKHKKSRKVGSQQRCKQSAGAESALGIEGPFFVLFVAMPFLSAFR
jgi:hypothetical protein